MDAIDRAKAAKIFAEKWKGKEYEKGESQLFWVDLLKNVYGVDNPTDFMECDVMVACCHYILVILNGIYPLGNDD